MTKIKLTLGQYAIIDDSLFGLINQYKWYARKDCSGYYAVRSTKKGTEFLHWYVIGKPIKGLVTDHINGNTLDNRRINLRIVSQRTNNQNTKNHRAGKLIGAHWNKKYRKWGASIKIDSKQEWLGYFSSEILAHEAYINRLKEAL